MNPLEWVDENLPEDGERKGEYYQRFTAANVGTLISKGDVTTHLRSHGYCVARHPGEKFWRYKLLPTE